MVRQCDILQSTAPQFRFSENKSTKSKQTNKLTLYLIETPFNPFANRTDPDQAALVRAA